MKIDFVNIVTLIVQLGPFMIVSYFCISSLLQQDIKALIYLIGVLIDCLITVILGNSMPVFTVASQSSVCTQISLSGTEVLSSLPLGISVYIFTLFYLIAVILLRPRSEQQLLITGNVGIISLLVVLSVFQMGWLLKNTCNTITQIFTAIIISGLTGGLWAAAINQTPLQKSQIFSVVSNAQVCSRPSQTRFVCKKRKNETS